MSFDESKIKRDGEGKFSAKDTPAEQKRADEILGGKQDLPSPKGKNKSESEFFGIEYTGVKGADAVEKLLTEKQGHVKSAFNRLELGGTGDIDLVWGDKTGGLYHLIHERDKDLATGDGSISGVEMAKKVANIVTNGDFNIDPKGRPCFELDGYRVAIKPTFDGKKLNWIITAMEIKKPVGG